MREEVTGTEENCTVRSFAICTLHQMLLGWKIQRGWDGHGM